MHYLVRTSLACLLACLLPVVAHAQADLFALEEDAMQAAAAAVAPSVVRIETVGGLEKVGSVLISEGPTTGLIVSTDGYILSSAFNFLGQPTSILVTLDDETRKPAKIVARDNSRMLVLLKIEIERELPVPQAAADDQITVGNWAIALGRAHDGPGVSISAGIVSAKNRIWDKAVQTDAKISPNNYGGPLIDIRGRVIGVLTPMSPQGAGQAAAGAEWYDSGIGFAAPLADIMPQLDRMKQGEDLHDGILGVALKGKDAYNDPVVIASVRPNSPASEAGIAADDKIVEAEGQPILRQTQLKHVLGGKYAGEQVKLIIARGEERLEMVVELTDKLDPFVHAFLGVLPMRNSAEGGIDVRYVFADSPAERAGIKAGDRLTKIADKPVTNLEEALATMNARKVSEEIEVVLEREGEEQTVKLTLSDLAATVPDELPPLKQPPAEQAGELAGVSEIKLPEETTTSFVYAPENYSAQQSYGLVVWLQSPGAFEEKELLEQWKDTCNERGLILLAPHPANSARWLPTEVEFVSKSIAAAQDRYSIDPQRIVVYGDQAGGSMAYLVALSNRELIRGVASLDAAVPMRGPAPENEPTMRLAIFSAVPADSKLAERISSVMKLLTEKKFPVTHVELPAGSEKLRGQAFDKLVRWLDSLDRF